MRNQRLGFWMAAFLAIGASALAGCGVAQPGLTAATGSDVAVLRKGPSKPPTGAPRIGPENFTQVNARLFRGGIPTQSDLLAFKSQHGIKTDIDLMGAVPGPQERVAVAQEQQAAAKAGIKFVNIPLPFKTPPQAMVDQFLSIVQDPANQPVYIHCLHGRDRTGTMVATYRIAVDGYTGQQALAEMETFGFKPAKYPFFAQWIQGFQPVR